MDENKQKLIEALEKERNKLEKFGRNMEGHNLDIEYLKTGDYDMDDIEKYDILYTCINDYEMMIYDYVTNP
ncbi:MAG TPA: hypothetical protein VK982_13600 [Bacteroidales bacterium]|nr:hypothetical protein [Bacteroidales bacterium]